jgi:alkylation response protein AidB-like acyl-CoA dehydrogenase
MRFASTDEQRQLAEMIDDIVVSAGGPAVARSWGSGDFGPGTALWQALAEAGLTGLRVDEADGGAGASVADLVIAFERFGYHAVPGPYVESVALLPRLVSPDLREQLLSGSAILTASVENLVPFAVDLAVSTSAFVVTESTISPATSRGDLTSLDPARRLSRLIASDPRALDPLLVAGAVDEATLATSAFLIGAGQRLLDESVGYAKVREQFGRPIGEYQAIKHALADVHIALTFARPLVHGASMDQDSPTTTRSVSAAKVAAGDAARLAARTAIQVHGAIGYTAEYDLSLWLMRVRALEGLWGTAAYHRARIAKALGQ